MSLLTSASVWTTDEKDPTTNRKRTPSMRKTIRRTDTYNEQPGEYTSQDEEYKKLSNTIEGTNEKQEVRNDHVNTLLNKITSVNADNAGNKLGNFNPIVNPALTVKAPPFVPSLPSYDDITSGMDNPLQIEPTHIPRTVGENKLYGSANGLGNSNMNGNGNGSAINYSNYKQSYEAPVRRDQGHGQGHDHHDNNFNNKLLDKINYMIHMLEEQHNEKTNNITEEFILYTFLGIFIIFIVDSFSRAGKYIR